MPFIYSAFCALGRRSLRLGVALMVLTLGVLLLPEYGHAQTVRWAASSGGGDFDRGHDIAVDAAGNSYVVGLYNGTATFGVINLTSAGSNDIFIAKYDSAGTLLWVRSAGGASNDIGNSIAVDTLGNSYITGQYNGTATFGAFMLTSAGSDDVFVAKYDSSGTVLWVQSTGGTSADLGNSIAVDAAGNSYVTGKYSGTATFGLFVLISAGADDVFVTKYDSTGTVLWAQSAGGTLTDLGNGIAVDTIGNTYITGNYNGAAAFGLLMISSAGSSDIFVAKYDSLGNVLWVTSAGGATNDQSLGIAVDTLGNSYITGDYSGTANFDALILVSAGSIDLFIAKYNSSGIVLWAKSAGGLSLDQGCSVVVDTFGNSYITGRYRGTAAFESFMMASAGSDDIFAAKYDSVGNVLWVQSAGGSSTDTGRGIGIDNAGNSYITGRYQQTSTFVELILTSAGSADIFVAKYSALLLAPDPPVQAAAPHDLPKQKYVSIDASANGTRLLAIKVIDENTNVKWAGAPFNGSDISNISPLSNTPFVNDWGSYSLLHLTGCIIQPPGAYVITFVEDPMGVNLSSSAFFGSVTCAWGDVQVSAGLCDAGIGDIIESININTFSPAATFPRPHGDVQGDVMDGALGIGDIIATINGVTVSVGTPFGYTPLANCP